MNRPANFDDLPVEERTRIIQDEITKIEEGKSHNESTVKLIRNLRLEIHNLLNPDVAELSYSQSEHESNGSGSSKSNVSEHGSSKSSHKSNVSEHGSNVSGHGSNTSGSSKSNVSEHGSRAHSSNVHSSDVSDVIVNVSTGLAVFNEFLDDPEIANYNKIEYFKERYLYLQNSKFFKLIFFH